MNLYEYDIPNSGERFDTLFEGKSVKIVRIISSDDIELVEYIQDEDEWVVLLEGEAVIEMEGEQKYLKRGDILFIPSKTPHKVLSTSKGALWLAVHIFN